MFKSLRIDSRICMELVWIYTVLYSPLLQCVKHLSLCFEIVWLVFIQNIGGSKTINIDVSCSENTYGKLKHIINHYGFITVRRHLHVASTVIPQLFRRIFSSIACVRVAQSPKIIRHIVNVHNFGGMNILEHYICCNSGTFTKALDHQIGICFQNT